MHPSSFQYQPPTIQRSAHRTPTFLCNKNIDKSGATLTAHKQFSHNGKAFPKEAS